jgi:uncharacterized membrane protein (Fun14 family)
MSESLGSIIAESLESITPILYSVSVGVIGGFLVGYMVKKILNLAIILGIFTLGILYLGQINVINLNFEEITALISKSENVIQTFAPLINGIPFVGSFFLGFLGGLR